LQIGYSEAGNSAENPPLIFLHGVGSDKSVWDFQVKELSKNRRVVAFDYAGYGESNLPSKDLTREEIARYVFGAMDALEIKRAHILGLSFGGVVALEMFAQNARRIMSLILADAFARHPRGGEIVERTLSLVEKMTMREFAEQRVEVLLMPEIGEQMRGEVVETFSKIPKQTFRWATRAVWAADYRNLLPQINVPTLILVGERDAVAPVELSKELAENITGARLEIISGASHLSNLDKPRVFNELIEKFIELQNQPNETNYKIADRN
jgi:3-oxoadipate enol-lactonase